MIAYTTLGTNDLDRAARFYDALLAVLGAKRVMEQPGYFIAYGNAKDGAGLGISLPFDKQRATAGNGTMVALEARDAAQVDAVHAKALALGGTDEGAPGRAISGFLRGVLPRPRRQQAQRVFHDVRRVAARAGVTVPRRRPAGASPYGIQAAANPVAPRMPAASGSAQSTIPFASEAASISGCRIRRSRCSSGYASTAPRMIATPP